MALAAVLGCAHGAGAQNATRTIASLPASIDMAVSVVGASSLMQGDRPLLVALSEWGWAQETKPAFEVLAARLGEPADAAFSRLLGRRATLVIREQEGESRWVVVSEVDAKTARRLPGQLEAKPLRLSSTLPVQGLERRRFEFTVSPINPNTNTAWAFLGPARASTLFDTIVGSVMGAPGGPPTLSGGHHSTLFKNPPKGSIAVFMQRPEPSRAVLASARRDEIGWDVQVRAAPATDWFAGLLPRGEDAPLVEPLPVLAEPMPADEVVSVWSLPWHNEPRLDAVVESVIGPVLWSSIMPMQSPRGMVLTREHDQSRLLVAALSEQPRATLARTDAMLASKARTSDFNGELPDAVRTSPCKLPVLFGKTTLTSIAWASLPSSSTPPPSTTSPPSTPSTGQILEHDPRPEDTRRRWLVFAAADQASSDLAERVRQRADACEQRLVSQQGVVLNHGRMRPRALLDGVAGLQDKRAQDAPTQRSAVGLLRTVERMDWRLSLVGDQLRARLRLDLVAGDEE